MANEAQRNKKCTILRKGGIGKLNAITKACARGEATVVKAINTMKERTFLHKSKGKDVLLAKFQSTNLPMCKRETKAFSAPRRKLRKSYAANVIGAVEDDSS